MLQGAYVGKDLQNNFVYAKTLFSGTDPSYGIEDFNSARVIPSAIENTPVATVMAVLIRIR